MNDKTLIVHTWTGTNVFNFASYPVHDWQPDLAERLARILTGDNGVIRSQVVHAWFDEASVPHEVRTDIDADGTETRRVRNAIQTRHGWTTDYEHPWKEEA